MILSSLRSRRALSFLQKVVGSGCPRGGWHSRVAVSPTATTVFCGFCLKSSRSTTKKKKGNGLISINLRLKGFVTLTLNTTCLVHLIAFHYMNHKATQRVSRLDLPTSPTIFFPPQGSEEPKQSQFLIIQLPPWRDPFWISRAKSMRI